MLAAAASRNLEEFGIAPRFCRAARSREPEIFFTQHTDVAALNGVLGGSEAQTDVLVPSSATLARASRLRLDLGVLEDVRLLLESTLRLDGKLGRHGCDLSGCRVVARSWGAELVGLMDGRVLMSSRQKFRSPHWEFFNCVGAENLAKGWDNFAPATSHQPLTSCHCRAATDPATKLPHELWRVPPILSCRGSVPH